MSSGVTICIKDTELRPPIRLDACIKVADTSIVDRLNLTYFSAKKAVFRARYEVDLRTSYLQVGMALGLVKEFRINGKKMDPFQFVAWYKANMPDVVSAKEEANWAGLIGITRGREYVYNNPAKYVPQLLLGALKKYYGLNTIVEIASTINTEMRKICSKVKSCAAHVHDSLVFEEPVSISTRWWVKEEPLDTWSVLGLIQANSDREKPPRHWLFRPLLYPDDIKLVNRLLSSQDDFWDVWKKLRHYVLHPRVIEEVVKSFRNPANGLVDIGEIFNFEHPDLDPITLN